MSRSEIKIMKILTLMFKKIIRLPLRLIPQRLVVRVMSGPLRGARWVKGASDNDCWLGWCEKAEAKAFNDSLQDDSVVWDVGANVGYYTLIAARGSPKRKVFAFEPLPSNIAIIRRHLTLNHLTNVSVIEAALSDRNGTAFFQESANNSMGRLQPDGKLKVTCVTIDGLIRDYQVPPPSVMKIDVEGAEFAALSGGINTLKRLKPIIFLATHSPELHRSCSGLLLDLNYELINLNHFQQLGCGDLMARPR